jgi:hypothetical protein
MIDNRKKNEVYTFYILYSSIFRILSSLQLRGYELMYRPSEYLNQVDTYKHSQPETVLRSDY